MKVLGPQYCVVQSWYNSLCDNSSSLTRHISDFLETLKKRNNKNADHYAKDLNLFTKQFQSVMLRDACTYILDLVHKSYTFYPRPGTQILHFQPIDWKPLFNPFQNIPKSTLLGVPTISPYSHLNPDYSRCFQN